MTQLRSLYQTRLSEIILKVLPSFRALQQVAARSIILISPALIPALLFTLDLLLLVLKILLLLTSRLQHYSGEANSVIRQRGTSEITNHLAIRHQATVLLICSNLTRKLCEIKNSWITGLSNRVINRAELIVEQEYSPSTFDNILTPPVNLYLDTKDTSTNGNYIPVPCDFSSTEFQSNFASMGGSRKNGYECGRKFRYSICIQHLPLRSIYCNKRIE